MTMYRLVDHGYPFKKIMRGKAWVGRVAKAPDGRWYGTIGKNTIAADTEIDAFKRVAARALGYSSLEELQERNARIRADNRVRKARVRHAFNEMLEGRFDALDALFNKAT